MVALERAGPVAVRQTRRRRAEALPDAGKGAARAPGSRGGEAAQLRPVVRSGEGNLPQARRHGPRRRRVERGRRLRRAPRWCIATLGSFARPLRQWTPATSSREASAMGGHDVEALLKSECRAALPLARQLLLYLDPFALFKDASRGSRFARECALSYNRAMRWMLVAYLRRWMLIAFSLFLCIAPAEAFAATAAAVPAVGCCLAVAVSAVIAAVYLLLGSSR